MLAQGEDTTVSIGKAVQTERLSTGKGILQKLFAFWFDALVYNQIWEDPRVDLEALQLDADSRVLTISSGGCNALNYLLADPQNVTAVDLNPHQIYLLKLKLAALQHLPDHESFFSFFGYGECKAVSELYDRHIAPNLDDTARTYWSSKVFLPTLRKRRRISLFESGGLYDHSRNGYFLKFFHGYARLLGLRPERILKVDSPAEQVKIHRQEIDPFFDNFIFRFVGKLPITMFGLGIPPQQFAELKNELDERGSIIEIYRERVRRLACDFPIEENYFAWQAFARRYDTERRLAVPEYLKGENYGPLTQKAGKLQTATDSVTELIKNNPTGTFNRFVLLDAQDWMGADAINELWTAIAERAERGSRIIFRTAGSASAVESSLSGSLRARFAYKKDLSLSLYEKDRSSIYGGFHLYVLEA